MTVTSSKRRSRGRKSRRTLLFNRRLATYAAAAGTALASASAADAITTRPLDMTIFDTLNVPLDINEDGTDDLFFNHDLSPVNAEAWVNASGGNMAVGFYESFTNSEKASLLRSSSYVGDSRNFYSGSLKLAQGSTSGSNHYSYGPFAGSSGFLGVKFNALDGLHYGFVQLSLEPTNSPQPQAIHILGVGYGGVDEAVHINVNAIPEPVGLGGLALGAVGLAAMRRRRSTSR